MEMLSIISFLIFFRRKFYSNVPLEIYLLSFLPFLGYIFRSFIVLFFPAIIYIISKRREFFFVSFLFISFSLFTFSLSKRIYPIYPFSRFSISYGLDTKIHLIISLPLLYLAYNEDKKLFFNEKLSFLFILLIIPAFFLRKNYFYYPEDLYNKPLKNFSYVCILGKVTYAKPVKFGGKIYYFTKICRNACVYSYFQEKISENEVLVCGYAVYKEGKVYLKYPSLPDHETIG